MLDVQIEPFSANDQGACFEREFRVLSAHLLAVRPEVARFTAADLEFGPSQGDDLPLRFASDDNQLHFHGNRPDLLGQQR